MKIKFNKKDRFASAVILDTFYADIAEDYSFYTNDFEGFQQRYFSVRKKLTTKLNTLIINKKETKILTDAVIKYDNILRSDKDGDEYLTDNVFKKGVDSYQILVNKLKKQLKIK